MAIRLSSHSLPLSFLVIFASNGYVIRFFRSLGRLVGWFVSWFRSGHAKLSLVGLSTQLCYRVECVNRGLSLRYNLGRISFSFVFHQPISSDDLCVCVCVCVFHSSRLGHESISFLLLLLFYDFFFGGFPVDFVSSVGFFLSGDRAASFGILQLSSISL